MWHFSEIPQDVFNKIFFQNENFYHKLTFTSAVDQTIGKKNRTKTLNAQICVQGVKDLIHGRAEKGFKRTFNAIQGSM